MLCVGIAQVRSHMSTYNAATLLSPGNNKLSLRNTPLRSTDLCIAKAMSFKHLIQMIMNVDLVA